MSFLYHTIFFDPLYNLLVLLLNISWLDAGLAVIILTILVRLILFPLSKKAVLTQVRMNEIAPKVEEIKIKYKDKPDEQARQTLSLYRENKVNPFAGIAVIIVQLPLIWALYRIFINFKEVRSDILYSFIRIPEHINSNFLGLINVNEKSLILALLAAVATFLQLYLSPANNSQNKPAKATLASNMQTQMKYFFPILVFFIAYHISAIIALYWLTTNLFSIAQELAIKKQSLKT